MSEWLEIRSVEMWLVEASQFDVGSAQYEEWVTYAKEQLMEWLTYAMKHFIVGYDIAKLRKILFLEGNETFNKWSETYCDTLERYLSRSEE